MLIQKMTRQACVELLKRTKIARLACSNEGQSYITPMSFVYDGDCLYSFSTVGQKITWMRANPLVCVEMDELVSPHEWKTVVALGRYEELANTPGDDELRSYAYALLRRRPLWWEPGYVKTIVDGKERPLEFLYFRIHIDQMSGHCGIPDLPRA